MVALIDYNAGNIRSVEYALERLGTEYVLTNDPDAIKNADKVIFPGVGEASTTMRFLTKKGLADLIPRLSQPVLGICLGMQLMCSHSEENDTECLGIFPLKVKQFVSNNRLLKVPHMGWNRIWVNEECLFPAAAVHGVHFYFVHSYYVETGKWTCATTDYILPFSAILKKDNFFATQFHPERSGPAGEKLLRAFLQSS